MKYLLVFVLLVSGPLFAQQPDPKPGRQLVQIPNVTGIKSTEACKIVLRVRIDELGNVVSAEVNRSMTTANMELINQVIALIKEQAKYSPQPGSPEATVSLTVRLRPD